MELSARLRSQLSSDEKTSERLVADIDLDVKRLFSISKGESPLEAFRRQELQIVEKVGTFFTHSLIPEILGSHLEGLRLPPVRKDLKTDLDLDMNNYWSSSAIPTNIEGRIRVEGTFVSDQPVEPGESIANARGKFASYIVASLIGQVKSILFGHDESLCETQIKYSVGPDDSKVVDYRSLVRGR